MNYNLDNGFLAYDQVGNGIPVLFIHGYPLSRKIWEPQLAGLSDIANIISLDLRGHGESFPFPPPYTMELLADDCKGLLDSLVISQPVVVCGLSMGGYITFALYRRYPQLFKAMILTSTRAGADSAEGKANRNAAITNVREQGVAFIADGMLNKLVSPETASSNSQLVNKILNIMLDTSVLGVVGASQAMRDRIDSTSTLPEIKVPVLIIHGADDQIIPTSEAQSMHALIMGSKLELIPQAGHLLNMEQPDNFNHAIRVFLRTLG